MKRPVKGVNDDGVELVEHEGLEKKFPAGFLKRQQPLLSERAEKI